MVRAAGLLVGIALLGLVPVSLRAESNGTVTATVVPASLAVTLEGPERPLKEGSPFPVTAIVSYAGEGELAATARLHLAPEALRVRDGIDQGVVLRPGHSERVRWQVCGEAAGSYVLMVSVEADGGAWGAESVAAVIEIKGAKHGGCPAGWS